MSDSPAAFIEMLARVVPDFETQARGARAAEIEALEGFCEGGLPSFYAWYLSVFGAHGGPFETRRFDFSIAAVLAHHRDAADDEDRDPEAPFVIAVGRDSVLPQDVAFDLGRRTPTDAFVVLAGAPIFDSLAAMLAWRLYERHRLPRFARRCSGVIRHRQVEFADELAVALEELGLVSTLDTGDHVKVLEGRDCAMTLLGNYFSMPTVAFELATPSSRHARALLGQLAVEHGFEIEALEWYGDH